MKIDLNSSKFDKLKREISRNVEDYNKLFSQLYFSENEGEKSGLEEKMMEIQKWRDKKGVEIKNSDDQWKSYILEFRTNEEKEAYDKLDKIIKAEVHKQDYERMAVLSGPNMEIRKSLCLRCNESDFYKLHNIYTLVSVTQIQKNIVENYA